MGPIGSYRFIRAKGVGLRQIGRCSEAFASPSPPSVGPAGLAPGSPPVAPFSLASPRQFVPIGVLAKYRKSMSLRNLWIDMQILHRHAIEIVCVRITMHQAAKTATHARIDRTRSETCD